MSRYGYENDMFEVFIGVDPVTSTFVQVSDKRNGLFGTKDAAEVVIDNQGVRRCGSVIPELEHHLLKVEKAFRDARSKGNCYPNLHAPDVCMIVFLLGFDDLETDIFQIIDGHEPIKHNHSRRTVE